jgi:peptidyl-Lys metalloendopeptidase
MLALVFALMSVGVSAAAPALECRVAPSPSSGARVVTFTLRNVGQRPVAVLDWNTPLEQMPADVFRIRREGGPLLGWHGPKVKRGDPVADDYVTILPGAEVSEEVDLGLGYELKEPGRYRVELAVRLHDVTVPRSAPRPRSRHRGQDLACPAIELTVKE